MMCRVVSTILLFQMAEAPVSATEDVHGAPPKRNFSKSRLVQRLVGKPALIRVGAATLYAHVRNSPHEWGRGLAGLGKRAGSAMGGHVVRGTVEYTVGTLLHEQLGYRRSEKEGFKPRLTHALLSTVITRKTTTGRTTPAVGRISGTLTSAMVSRLWMPVRLHTVSSGFASAGITMGVDTGANVVREFWPEIRHPRRRKARKVEPIVAPSPIPIQ
jgi:hypothetical protein